MDALPSYFIFIVIFASVFAIVMLVLYIRLCIHVKTLLSNSDHMRTKENLQWIANEKLQHISTLVRLNMISVEEYEQRRENILRQLQNSEKSLQ